MMDTQAVLQNLASLLERRIAANKANAEHNAKSGGMAWFTEAQEARADEGAAVLAIVRQRLKDLGDGATFASLTGLLHTLPPGFSGAVQLTAWQHPDGVPTIGWTLCLLGPDVPDRPHFRRESPTAAGIRRAWTEEALPWLARQCAKAMPLEMLEQAALADAEPAQNK